MGREVRRDEAFGARLVAAMERRGMRPGELAKAQDVSPGTVSRWRGGECPDDLRFPSLAADLEVPEEWLKTGAGGPPWDAPPVVAERRRPAEPGRRKDDVELRAAALRKDAARLDALLKLIRTYREMGRPASPEVLEEWEAIARANRLPENPPATPLPGPANGPGPG